MSMRRFIGLTFLPILLLCNAIIFFTMAVLPDRDAPLIVYYIQTYTSWGATHTSLGQIYLVDMNRGTNLEISSSAYVIEPMQWIGNRLLVFDYVYEYFLYDPTTGEREAVSLDFDRTVYSSDGDIFLRDLDTDQEIRITNTPDYAEFSPNMAPDGCRISYLRSTEFIPVSLMVHDRCTGETNEFVQDISDIPAFIVVGGEQFLWSNSGNYLLCTNCPLPDGTYIQLIDVRTGQRIELNYLTSSSRFAWSPLGDQLLYTGNDWMSSLFVADLETGALTQLTDFEGQKYAPIWSPDGSQLVFAMHNNFDGRSTRLYLMDADGSNLRRIPNSFHESFQVIDIGWQP